MSEARTVIRTLNGETGHGVFYMAATGNGQRVIRIMKAWSCHTSGIDLCDLNAGSGKTTVTLEREETLIVFGRVPAKISPDCGKSYPDDVVDAVYHAADEAAKVGVEVDVRGFIMSQRKRYKASRCPISNVCLDALRWRLGQYPRGRDGDVLGYLQPSRKRLLTPRVSPVACFGDTGPIARPCEPAQIRRFSDVFHAVSK